MNNEWKKEFARRIRRKMVAKHMNQRELARIAGIHEVTLSRYICCTRTPPIHIVCKLAIALDCEFDYLVYGVPNCLYLESDADERWQDNFINNVIHRMQILQMPRAYIARETGLDYLTIYFYLKGVKTPSLPAAMRICKVFGCTLGELI